MTGSDNVDAWLNMIGRTATRYGPRLFTVYGAYHQSDDRPDVDLFVGWGMDLGGGQGALYWDPSDASTFRSGCAENVLSVHQRIGVARLAWLDQAPTGAAIRSSPE